MKNPACLAALTISGLAGAQSVSVLSLQTTDIVYDSANGSIYAGVPSSAGTTYGNSLVQINPSTASITNSTYIGSEPSSLAISGDGTVIYAGFTGTNSIESYNTVTGTAGTPFSLGSGGFFGPYFAGDIQVMPGQDNTIAVSRVFQGVDPASAGVAIYDNGVMRTNATSQNYPTIDSITWVNPSLLYGYNNETTGFDLYNLNVDANGVTVGTDSPNLVSGFGAQIQYVNGLVYSTTGRAVNPAQNLIAGTFQASGPFAVDPSANLIFYLTGSGSTRTIQEFNLSTYVMTKQFTVNGVNGNVESLLQYGPNDLAFDTTGGQVFFISGAPVPEPASCVILACGGAALLTRRKRCSGK